jgi:hypothetical protein
MELGKACSTGYIQVKHKGGGNFGRHNDERAKSGPLATSSYLLVHSKTKACELLTARFASGNPTNTNAILISKLLGLKKGDDHCYLSRCPLAAKERDRRTAAPSAPIATAPSWAPRASGTSGGHGGRAQGSSMAATYAWPCPEGTRVRLTVSGGKLGPKPPKWPIPTQTGLWYTSAFVGWPSRRSRRRWW